MSDENNRIEPETPGVDDENTNAETISEEVGEAPEGTGHAPDLGDVDTDTPEDGPAEPQPAE